MYHSVSDGKNILSVPIKNFENQMKFMHNNGYTTINLNELPDIKNCKSFVITFDDGYEDVLINALPILKKYNFTATCFFVSKYIGKYNVWDESRGDFERLNLMSNDQILLWIHNNMKIGSHTSDHKNLSNLSYEDKISQIVEPINFFKDIFNLNINVFSYPFGSFDNETYDIVKKNYRFAVTTKRSRYIVSKFDNCKLPRVPVNKYDSFFKFYIKVKTIYEDIKFK